MKTAGILCASMLLLLSSGFFDRVNAQNNLAALYSFIDEENTLQTGEPIFFRDAEALQRILADLEIETQPSVPKSGLSVDETQVAVSRARALHVEFLNYMGDNPVPQGDTRQASLEFRSAILRMLRDVEAAHPAPDGFDYYSKRLFPDLGGGATFFDTSALMNAVWSAVAHDRDVGFFFTEGQSHEVKGSVFEAGWFYYAGIIAGDAASLNALVKLYQSNPEVIPSLSHVRVLAALRPEGTLQVMTNILNLYLDEVNELYWGVAEQPEHFVYGANSILVASAFILAFGDEYDEALVSELPLNGKLLNDPTFWAVTENAGDLQYQYAHVYDHFPHYCASFLYRDQDEAEQLRNSYIDSQLNRFYKPAEINRVVVFSMQQYHTLNLSLCNLNSTTTNDLWDTHKKNYSGDLTWLKQPEIKGELQAVFQTGQDQRNRLRHIDYFAEEVLAILDDLKNVPPAGHSAAFRNMVDEAVRLYLATTENTHLETGLASLRIGIGRGHRRMVYRVVKDTPRISFGALVDFVPRIQEDTLQVGIRVNALFGQHVTSGLAIAIGEHDKVMEALLKDDAKPMIEGLYWEKNAARQPLEYVRTTGGGTHIYQLNGADSATLTGFLSLDMAVMDDAWQLNWPLMNSQYALKHRLSQSGAAQ